MPWCESCEAFYNPNTLRPDGSCPRCGAQVGDATAVATDLDDAESGGDRVPQPGGHPSGDGDGHDELDDDEELVAKVPWHFWVGVVAMVIYLGWRLIQGVVWLF